MKHTISKRFLTVMLCFCMAFSPCIPAAADEDPEVSGELTTEQEQAVYGGEDAVQVTEAEAETTVSYETFSSPLAAATFLAGAALEMSGEIPTTAAPETTAGQTSADESSEHPAVLAAEERMEAAEHSIYNTMAVSQVEDYVNIRSAPEAEAEVVGKIYNNAVATIIETVDTADGTWYHVTSGSVDGYIKAEYFATGEDAQRIVTEIGYVSATVNVESLRMRESADLGSKTIAVLPKDESYKVEEQGEEFSKISIDDEVIGYVQNDYIQINVQYESAISIEEEQAKLAEEARLRKEAEEAAARLKAQQEEESRAEASKAAAKSSKAKKTTEAPTESTKKKTTEAPTETTKQKTTEAPTETSPEPAETQPDPTETSPDPAETTPEPTETSPEPAETTTEKETTTTPKATTAAPGDNGSSALRDAIVSEALTYVGKLPYVWGGTSLETGADCSGFVQSIYKMFGIKLPRASDDQGYCGRAVSSADIRPGDLVYYGGHIAIYIGDGYVVHASGVTSIPNTKVSTWNYRSVIGIRDVIGDR